MITLTADQTYAFEYADKDGNRTARVVRVEEVQPDQVVGLCYYRGAPRAFKNARISNVSIVSEPVSVEMFRNAPNVPACWLNA